MALLFDCVLIASLCAWIIGLAVDGHMSPETAAISLLGLAACIGIGRAKGLGIVRLLFRIGVPLASFVGLVVRYGSGDLRRIMSVLSVMLPLFVALTGIYIIFRGVFAAPRKHR